MKKTLLIRLDGNEGIEMPGVTQEFADIIVLNAQQGWAAGNGFIDIATGEGDNARRLTINTNYIQSIEVKRNYHA